MIADVVVIESVAAQIGTLFRKAHATHVDSVRYLIECGERLSQKRKSLNYGQWLPWLEENREALGFGERTAQLLISACKANPQLTSDLPPAEVLKINRQIWGNPAANYSSETNEWYTPAAYVESVRTVFGGEIDLDPASCEFANRSVKAREFFSTDGETREWHGRVFCNPPYGVDDGESRAGMFCNKAIAEFKAGRVSECILLVNAAPAQAWQRPLYAHVTSCASPTTEFALSTSTGK